MAELAQHSEEQYDKILLAHDADQNQLQQLRELLNELQANYDMQAKELRDSNKKVLNAAEVGAKNLASKIDCLLKEKRELMANNEKLGYEIKDLARTKRGLEQNCCAWKVHARESREMLPEKDKEEQRAWLRVQELEKENADLQQLLGLCEEKEGQKDNIISTTKGVTFTDNVRLVMMQLLKLHIAERKSVQQ